MDRLAVRLRENHQVHKTQNLHLVVAGMHQDVVANARPALIALLGAVGFVLLIACANVANLLLVRASERGREIAVRAALGSGRGRIVAQMLTESLVLAVGGTVLGLLLAWQGIRVIKALSPANLPRIESVSLDGGAFLFAALVAIVAALLFGLAPALRAVRGNLSDGLRDRGTDTGGARGNKLRTVLVVSEVTLSLVLLIGAGLMVRSFAAIQKVDPGFDARNVVTFNAPIPFIKYLSSQARATFFNQLGDRLATIPGVEAVGGVTPLPLAGGEQYAVGSYGKVGETDEVYRTNKADYRAVLPGYFEVMRIALLSGRTFTRADNEQQALPVAIIDAKMAARLFGNGNPLGAQFLIDRFDEKTFQMGRAPVTVVGVVGNVRSTSLASEGRETIYVPYVIQAFLPITFTVRTANTPGNMADQIRNEVKALDADVPVADLATLESWVAEAMSQTKFLLALSGTFAGLALVLAALGLYGVIAYSVRQRTREIGVRAALGASDRDVLRLILGQGLLVATIGIVLGLAASIGLTRIVSSYLVGVGARDPLTFIGVPLLLLIVATVASYLPARRAVGIEPITALHEE
jgi:putative ABC transport system permease protein